jgi:hypothetical protein
MAGADAPPSDACVVGVGRCGDSTLYGLDVYVLTKYTTKAPHTFGKSVWATHTGRALTNVRSRYFEILKLANFNSKTKLSGYGRL